MEIAVHYCHIGFANCYMLGLKNGDGNKDAIVIDPGCMNESVLNFIERKKYRLLAVLITHKHENHIRGLSSLMRIYDAGIYAAQHKIAGFPVNIVRDGDILNIGAFNIEVISVPGHSADSVVYKIQNHIFTGDVLTAGVMGSTSSAYGAMRQIAAVQNKLFTLTGKNLVFPGHGPPSLMDSEKMYNVETSRFMEKRKQSERYWYRNELF